MWLGPEIWEAFREALGSCADMRKLAMFDEGTNDPPPPQSRKIPKRPKSAAWQYDPRPVWDL